MSMRSGGTRGFSLVEVLVVLMIIAILALLAIIALNPARQRMKVYDIKRKRDLNNLKSLYELFKDQHLRYPTGAELCYDTPVSDGGTCTCHICGLEQDSKIFGQAIHTLYCDPEYPKASYVYQFDCSDNPLWYKLYSNLSIDDPSKNPGPDATCRYGVSNRPDSFLQPYSDACGGVVPDSGGGSGGGGGGGGSPTATPTPGPTIPVCPADPIPKYCQLGGICNICGDFATCLNPASCDHPLVLYSNSLCTNACTE